MIQFMKGAVKMPKKKSAPQAPAKNLFPVADAERLAKRMEPSMQVLNHIYLAEKKGNCSTGRVPSLHVYHDAHQFFDPDANAIHIGSHGPIEYFQVEDELTYESGLKFLMGHENEHVFSTATVPYQKGIFRGVQVIIEQIARIEGINKRFRNEKDYDVFVRTDLRAKNIYINVRTLTQLVGHIMNSVEDGRIERIRSLRYPGFALQRRYFRGIEWNQDVEYIPYDKMTNETHLETLIMVIHSLATKNLFPKGFVMQYAGTPIMDEVLEIMPFVAKAVLAGKTRHMADNVVKIVEKLAPLIYDIYKKNAAAEEAMAEMLKQLLSQLISALDPDKMHQLSEREEGEASQEECPVFEGMSDLVITLDDETFDKLQEQSKQNGNKGPGIMVRREHPKDEEKKGDKDGKGSGNGEEDDKKDEKNGKGSSKSAQKGDEKGNSIGQKGDSSDEKGNASSDSNSDSDSTSSQSSQNATSDKPSLEESHNNTTSSMKPPSEEGSGSRGSGEQGGSIEDVLEAMKEAAQKCREEASDDLSTINRAVVSSSKSKTPVVENLDKPLTHADVKDVMGHTRFEEVARKYKLDKHLPSVLNTRARAFRKKNERYFKSLSTPNITNLSSGGVDPSLIYGLTYGETNIFRKLGQDKKFDGCVYMLLDNSGSTMGAKRMEECKAAAVVEEGFKGLLPLKIVAFDYSGGVIHEVIKGWDESQKMNCCYNFAMHGRNGCGNCDNYDIDIAAKELLARPERKKLLIVLSDGAPADSEATRIAIANARKKGITVFGIYFEEGAIGAQANTFKKMYEKDYVCVPANEIDETLTKLMIKFSRS